MKVYSWNVYYRSKKLNDAFAYIQALDFDVLCLQEVPEEFLNRLKTLPYHMTSAIDLLLFSKKKEQTIYSVILSRHPIQASGAITFPRIVLPGRSALLLRAKSGWSDFRKNGSVYADIDFGNRLTRVFSVHLALLSPSERAREFAVVQSFLPKDFPAIVAGDFNVIEHVLIKPFNWLTGGSVREALPWHRERTHAEARFKDVQLKNPLRGKVTHGFSRSQLDHILVPEKAHVLEAQVIKKTYGSDHHPVFLEIA